MSIIGPVVGDTFRVRIQSYHSLNPSQKWSNNYLIRCRENTDYSAITRAATQLLTFHDNITYAEIITEKAVVSTYAPDTNPYDGNEFTSVDYNQSGSLSGGGATLLPLEACLYIRKSVYTGRVGKIFIRGALNESDVAFGQSLFKLEDIDAAQARIDAAMTLSQVDEMFITGGDDFILVMPTGADDTAPSRAIRNFEANGVRFVNMNKRYYDRV